MPEDGVVGELHTFLVQHHTKQMHPAWAIALTPALIFAGNKRTKRGTNVQIYSRLGTTWSEACSLDPLEIDIIYFVENDIIPGDR